MKHQNVLQIRFKNYKNKPMNILRFPLPCITNFMKYMKFQQIKASKINNQATTVLLSKKRSRKNTYRQYDFVHKNIKFPYRHKIRMFASHAEDQVFESRT